MTNIFFATERSLNDQTLHHSVPCSHSFLNNRLSFSTRGLLTNSANDLQCLVLQQIILSHPCPETVLPSSLVLHIVSTSHHHHLARHNCLFTLTGFSKYFIHLSFTASSYDIFPIKYFISFPSLLTFIPRSLSCLP